MAAKNCQYLHHCIISTGAQPCLMNESCLRCHNNWCFHYNQWEHPQGNFCSGAATKNLFPGSYKGVILKKLGLTANRMLGNDTLFLSTPASYLWSKTVWNSRRSKKCFLLGYWDVHPGLHVLTRLWWFIRLFSGEDSGKNYVLLHGSYFSCFIWHFYLLLVL